MFFLGAADAGGACAAISSGVNAGARTSVCRSKSSGLWSGSVLRASGVSRAVGGATGTTCASVCCAKAASALRCISAGGTATVTSVRVTSRCSGVTVSSGCVSRRAVARCPTDGQRTLGVSPQAQRMMAPETDSLSSGRSSRGVGMAPARRRAWRSAPRSLPCGASPVSSSNITTPSAQMSARWSTPAADFHCSGAM